MMRNWEKNVYSTLEEQQVNGDIAICWNVMQPFKNNFEKH